jgi:hypothetical protein
MAIQVDQNGTVSYSEALRIAIENYQLPEFVNEYNEFLISDRIDYGDLMVFLIGN